MSEATVATLTDALLATLRQGREAEDERLVRLLLPSVPTALSTVASPSTSAATMHGSHSITTSALRGAVVPQPLGTHTPALPSPDELFGIAAAGALDPCPVAMLPINAALEGKGSPVAPQAPDTPFTPLPPQAESGPAAGPGLQVVAEGGMVAMVDSSSSHGAESSEAASARLLAICRHVLNGLSPTFDANGVPVATTTPPEPETLADATPPVAHRPPSLETVRAAINAGGSVHHRSLLVACALIAAQPSIDSNIPLATLAGTNAAALAALLIPCAGAPTAATPAVHVLAPAVVQALRRRTDNSGIAAEDACSSEAAAAARAATAALTAGGWSAPPWCCSCSVTSAGRASSGEACRMQLQMCDTHARGSVHSQRALATLHVLDAVACTSPDAAAAKLPPAALAEAALRFAMASLMHCRLSEQLAVAAAAKHLRAVPAVFHAAAKSQSFQLALNAATNSVVVPSSNRARMLSNGTTATASVADLVPFVIVSGPARVRKHLWGLALSQSQFASVWAQLACTLALPADTAKLCSEVGAASVALGGALQDSAQQAAALECLRTAASVNTATSSAKVLGTAAVQLLDRELTVPSSAAATARAALGLAAWRLAAADSAQLPAALLATAAVHLGGIAASRWPFLSLPVVATDGSTSMLTLRCHEAAALALSEMPRALSGCACTTQDALDAARRLAAAIAPCSVLDVRALHVKLLLLPAAAAVRVRVSRHSGQGMALAAQLEGGEAAALKAASQALLPLDTYTSGWGDRTRGATMALVVSASVPQGSALWERLQYPVPPATPLLGPAAGDPPVHDRAAPIVAALAALLPEFPAAAEGNLLASLSKLLASAAPPPMAAFPGAVASGYNDSTTSADALLLIASSSLALLRRTAGVRHVVSNPARATRTPPPAQAPPRNGDVARWTLDGDPAAGGRCASALLRLLASTARAAAAAAPAGLPRAALVALGALWLAEVGNDCSARHAAGILSGVDFAVMSAALRVALVELRAAVCTQGGQHLLDAAAAVADAVQRVSGEAGLRLEGTCDELLGARQEAEASAETRAGK
jgi:hypothetical protein